ncbi:TPA: hypothetical protein O9466_000020 [Staphylococcus aureus]|nr:hypothetical protein [Staphylococcus aureus]HDD0323205.1 hypothetical protein [Staphylococcus aureus]HDD0482121.1 hypothetical protein [Staphylococcus aureus]HDD0596582.1 hypothetical protein [Staphylococcus aureus]
MSSLITSLIIAFAFAILSQWLLIAVIRSLEQEKNIDVGYICLFIGYIAIFLTNKEKIESHFYEISLTFIIVSLITNWLYSNFLYMNNQTPAEENGKSIVELFLLLIESIKLVTPKNVKNIKQNVKKKVKHSMNKQRIVLYSLAFICSILAQFGIIKPLDSSFTTFIIFDVIFTLFTEQYYFNS